MSRYPAFSSDTVAALQAQCRSALDAFSPELAAAGGRLLAMHTCEQWPVEWHLPWWLAQELRLPDDAWRALTVCNLLGLGYVRLQDHLAEQTTADGLTPGRQAVLAGAFYEASLASLVQLFDGAPEFWRCRSGYMAAWLAALLEDGLPLSQPAALWQEAELLRLADRGAPLKISAAGACLLAGRAQRLPRLEQALDHLLTAQVLLDHVDDWREDLAQGRANVLVAFASDLPQERQHAEANQRRVLALWMLGDPAGYWQHVQRHLARAGALAEAIPCAGLARFVAAQSEEADAAWRRLIAAARGHLAGAVSRLLD